MKASKFTRILSGTVPALPILAMAGLTSCSAGALFGPRVAGTIHQANWMDPASPGFHGAIVRASRFDYTKAIYSGVTCNTCHAGANPSQKSPFSGAPNCFSCHVGGPDGSAGHPPGWGLPMGSAFHGAVVVAAGYDYTRASVGPLACAACHAGLSPAQPSVNSRAPNCFSCHVGGPDGSAGHPPGWGLPTGPIFHGAVVMAAGYDYTKAAVGPLTCAACHAGSSPGQPSPNLRAPNCFSCHVGGPDGSAGHPPSWLIPPLGPVGKPLDEFTLPIPTFSNFEIVPLPLLSPSTTAGQVVVGDTAQLQVVQVMSDGSTVSVPNGATIDWIGPQVLVASDSSSGLPPDASTLLATDSIPTGFFVRNPARTDHASDLANVLFFQGLITGTGSVTVGAAISGGGVPSGTAPSIYIPIGPMPTGTAAFGAIKYAANCASCHGDQGQGGGVAAPDAPGLNDASPGGAPNLAADPGWSPALLAFAAKSDVDNTGLTLDLPMVNWLSVKSANCRFLATQDYADIYAWLKTQSTP